MTATHPSPTTHSRFSIDGVIDSFVIFYYLGCETFLNIVGDVLAMVDENDFEESVIERSFGREEASEERESKSFPKQ
jgi:hypothetical protein